MSMVEKILWFVIAGVALVSYFGVMNSRAQAKATWTYVRCPTNACIAETLNGLSLDRAHVAKLTTWGQVTDVWYPK